MICENVSLILLGGGQSLRFCESFVSFAFGNDLQNLNSKKQKATVQDFISVNKDSIALDSNEFTSIKNAAFLNSKNFTKKPPKKQWIRIGDLPLWCVVARRILAEFCFKKVIITLPQNELKYAQKYLNCVISYSQNSSEIELIAGGNSRQESLQNALKEINSEFVLCSDIARACVPLSIFVEILNLIKSQKDFDCIAPALNFSDTIAFLDSIEFDYKEQPKYLKRENLRAVQTPQLSRTKTLKAALAQNEFTDESSAIAALNGKVIFSRGSEISHKITHFSDLFKLNLPRPSSQIFVGSGFDVHKFEENESINQTKSIESKTIKLCGLSIPSDRKLLAHSDGDVALHALADALCGAFGAGDIGEWFSDSDDKFKGADSAFLLKEIADFSREVGYEITQIDLCIIAQKPKISPYKNAMEARIAEILEIPQFLVNVKATTTEKLGFVGRSEGIAVMANVLLKYFDWGADLDSI